MRVVCDAMGSDYGAKEVVEGAIAAINEYDVDVILVGKSDVIGELLNMRKFRSPRLSVVHASEEVTMHDSPKDSLKKKDSSIMVAQRLVSEGKADAMVSAGNTGAVLASTLIGWRCLEGISRPAIAMLMPSRKQPVLMLDVGANIGCRPRVLFEFAMMGSVYAREVLQRDNPRIGLLNIGSEAGKGNELLQETHQILAQSELNFKGNAEGGDILSGDFDVVVCDGMIGNIILKFGESIASMVLHSLKGEISKNYIRIVGGILLTPVFRKFKKSVDYAEHGGAPMLGLNGVCIICHGASRSKAVKNAIRAAAEAVRHNLNTKIAEMAKRIKTSMKFTPPPPSPLLNDTVAK